MQQDCSAVELVVTDCGSTDDPHAILHRLSPVFGDRLRWYAAPDSGPTNAVNKALALARGDIVGWLNADDLYTPGSGPETRRTEPLGGQAMCCDVRG